MSAACGALHKLNMFCFTFLFLFHFPLVSAITRTLTCLSSRNLPPLLADCNDLNSALFEVSRQPAEQVEKTWGPTQTDGPTTAKVPKYYFIHGTTSGRMPTCLVRVDFLERHTYDNFDQFPLRAAAVGSVAITERCLARQGKVGWNFPGLNKTIFVKLARLVLGVSDRQNLIQAASKSWNVTMNGEVLDVRMVTGDSMSSLLGLDKLNLTNALENGQQGLRSNSYVRG